MLHLRSHQGDSAARYLQDRDKMFQTWEVVAPGAQERERVLLGTKVYKPGVLNVPSPSQCGEGEEGGGTPVSDHVQQPQAWGAGRFSQPVSPIRPSPRPQTAAIQDSQIKSPVLPGTSKSSQSGTPVQNTSTLGENWVDIMEREEEATEEDEDTSSMSALNSVKRANSEYMEQRKWVRDAKKEVTAAFSKIQEYTSTAETEEVEVEHHFNTEEQLKIHAQKRRLEDCGVVFCTVDISPSRDTFTQWLYYEVENKTAVQISHVKVLAPRHYLVILHSMEARDAVLVGGPYYMRKRMIYTTPWEPGFDTHKVLAKKMAVWLDLFNVDPMMEGVGNSLLGSLGSVLQVTGTTEKMEGKFANIRGCVLMDMTKPLPSVLVLHMNKIKKKIKIRYDILPDACFKCHECGHFARICPQNFHQQDRGKEPAAADPDPDADFQEVKRKGRANPEGSRWHIPEQSNSFEVLGEVSGENVAVEEVPSSSGNGVADTEDAMDIRTEEEEPRKESAHRSAASDEERSALQSEIPDLNVTPAELLSLSSEKPGKKKNNKAKQREKRKEEKIRKETEKEVADQFQGLEEVEEGEVLPIEVGSDSSGSEEEEGNNRLWQTDGKKRRGEKEAMETTTGWEESGAVDKARLPLNEIRAVKCSLQNSGRSTKILALQELKTQERQVEFNLRNLMPGAKVVVDYAENELGGAALVIHESIKVVSTGVKGTGQMAWACVEVHGHQFMVASIYGPHGPEEKIQFFHWLRDKADDSNWIILGDWNMVLTPEDSSGPTPILKGGPLQAWGEVELKWNFEDVYNIALHRR
ncbi:hypothetical protein R1sor_025586 [Riccia sorocarpa]|uniref:CCHC-type domain-containing protein n=1 Tax=Riccia sorocarpa TaxID=122646 RepID=A0ABD3G9J3_9MARC